MKKSIILFLLVTMFFGASCTSTTTISTVKTNESGKVPPGQMKKMTGEKSAKRYAPGQQKKNK